MGLSSACWSLACSGVSAGQAERRAQWSGNLLWGASRGPKKFPATCYVRTYVDLVVHPRFECSQLKALEGSLDLRGVEARGDRTLDRTGKTEGYNSNLDPNSGDAKPHKTSTSILLTPRVGFSCYPTTAVYTSRVFRCLLLRDGSAPYLGKSCHHCCVYVCTWALPPHLGRELQLTNRRV